MKDRILRPRQTLTAGTIVNRSRESRRSAGQRARALGLACSAGRWKRWYSAESSVPACLPAPRHRHVTCGRSALPRPVDARPTRPNRRVAKEKQAVPISARQPALQLWSWPRCDREALSTSRPHTHRHATLPTSVRAEVRTAR